jgi:RNA polymerase sigma factor (sigma-70 family)
MIFLLLLSHLTCRTGHCYDKSERRNVTTMNDWLVDRFEEQRSHLRAVAYRMLGSVSEADDAVQEAWLRLNSSDADGIENMGGWLTTVVARICLNMLQSRKTRREDPLEAHFPEPIVSPEDGVDPEDQALLADSVGLALLVVLETLSPAERLAFVLHDMFAVPFEEIAALVDRSPTAARQLASRARKRVQGAAAVPDTDIAQQWEVVDAFIAASREGDFDALVAVLDPDIVLRADRRAGRGAPVEVHGAVTVAKQAFAFRRFSRSVTPVLVNGAAGLLATQDGRAVSVMGFTIQGGKVVAIDIVADPESLAKLDLQIS